MKRVTLKMRKPCIVYWLENNLYLNITNKCPNNCYFCFRNFTHGLRGFDLKLRQEPSSEEVITELQKVVNKQDWDEIVFCGFGEPLERLDCVVRVTKWIKKHLWKAVRIDTNGQGFLLNKGRNVLEELKEAGVDKISVSLNAHDKNTYNRVCKPNFKDAYESVLEFIEKASKEFDLEITAVAIPEIDVSRIEEVAEKMRAKFRTRRFIPCFW